MYFEKGEAVVKGQLSDIKKEYGFRNLTIEDTEENEKGLQAIHVSYEKQQGLLYVKVQDDAEGSQHFTTIARARCYFTTI